MIWTPSKRIIRPNDKPPFELTQRFGLNRRDSLIRELVGYWLLNEAGGDTVYDLSGEGHHGTIPSGIEWRGWGENAKLEGNNSAHIECAGGHGVTGYPFTLGGCYQFDTDIDNTDALFGIGDGDAYNYYFSVIAYTNGNYFRGGLECRVDASGGQAITATTYAYPFGAPHIVVGVFRSATDRELYVDGISRGTDTDSVAWDASCNECWLGEQPNSGTDYPFENLLHWAALWDRELDLGEIGRISQRPYDLPQQAIRRALWMLGGIAEPGGGGQTEALAGSITATSSVTGAMNVKKALVGSVDGVSSITAAMNVKKSLAVAIAATSSVTAAMQVKKSLAATIAAVSNVSASMKAGKSLAATIAAVSTVSGSLNVKKSLAGSIAAVSTISGTLATAGEEALAGSITAVSNVSGSLSVKKSLSGSIAAVSTVSGTLNTGDDQLAGSITATSNVNGSLNVRKSLSGSVAATSDVSGRLYAKKSLAGTIDAVSNVSGTLSGGGEIETLAGSITVVSNVSGTLSVTELSDLLAMMHDDMVMALNDCGTAFVVQRKKATWSGGVSSLTWETIYASLAAVWQPKLDGKSIRREQGKSVKSTAKIMVVRAADIREDDKVYQTGEDEYYVNYVREYEGHKSIFLKQTVGVGV